MNKNIGLIDKILRILVGLGTYTLFFTDITSGVLGLVLVALGTVFLLTAFVNVCPLYKLFGLKTN